MGLRWAELAPELRETLRRGGVYPAHPLALDDARRLDARRQRALSRYYIDAGAAGLAVGVHTTQFAIREAGLYEAVLGIAAQTVADWARRPVLLIAGVVGRTAQAVAEARLARSLGYHAALLSLAAFRPAAGAALDEDAVLAHCAAVAEEIPLVGFYLQPAVGGVILPARFWRRFAEIPEVVAIKVAPFDRYRTLDVLRGVAEAGAAERITLLTGNDDHIMEDLLTPHPVRIDGQEVVLRFRGGLLGQFCVWTRAAVELCRRAEAAAASGRIPAELLARGSQLTQANAAIFDAAHGFAGVIAGCHHVLMRQGLLAGTWCLDPRERLSPGQAAAIEAISAACPELTDDDFVRDNRERWLS
jgi:dihydrodipicolinate synthase/N-acetylneuraminate lyase